MEILVFAVLIVIPVVGMVIGEIFADHEQNVDMLPDLR